ncbi:PetM family cytochrome b6-f complex subunit 7 [Microcoleus sp. FACHB-672]|nr:PetM family cytochrome b6-f complex subunit 7 [Microcoleus sp. FACHB-672]MBD2041945.1 cytochrome B6 [Microcoleus sp. FACHB-672]
MSGEIFNAALLSFSLVFVGIAAGFVLLKIQGAEKE